MLKFNFGCGEQCLDIYLTMLGLEYQLVMYPLWQSITPLIIFLRGRLVVWGKAINPTCVQVKWTVKGGLPDSLPSTTSELLVSYTDCAHETKGKKHQISTSSVGVKYNLKYLLLGSFQIYKDILLHTSFKENGVTEGVTCSNNFRCRILGQNISLPFPSFLPAFLTIRKARLLISK